VALSRPDLRCRRAAGQKKWEFLTVGGTDEALETWGNESWRTGGGGGWMPGTFDTASNTVWWGTANPAPLYEWSGPDYKTSGARPETISTRRRSLGSIIDTGNLKFYYQELPHDTWAFDSAVGEFILLDREGKHYVVHPNKSGFIFVYDRADAKVENLWPIVTNINFVKTIDPKTGELIGRRGKLTEPLCPHISGGVSWNSGSYNPATGMYYKLGQDGA
jgi:glucose dehydrogenase